MVALVLSLFLTFEFLVLEFLTRILDALPFVKPILLPCIHPCIIGQRAAHNAIVDAIAISAAAVRPKQSSRDASAELCRETESVSAIKSASDLVHQAMIVFCSSIICLCKQYSDQPV